MSDSTSRLLRGFLEPCLLALLAPSPDYGLSLMRRLSAAGLEEVPGGSLYPALTRLERRGLVSTSTRPSASGPARKYYELTAAGRPQHAAPPAAMRTLPPELAARRAEWRSFRTAFSAILESSTATTETRS